MKPTTQSIPIEDELSINGVTCSTCRVGMKTFDSLFESPEIVSKIEAFSLKICLKYLYYGEEVCTDMINRMAPIIIDVVAHSYLSGDYVCAYLTGLCASPTYTPEYAEDYKQNMLSGKPDLIKNNDYVN